MAQNANRPAGMDSLSMRRLKCGDSPADPQMAKQMSALAKLTAGKHESFTGGYPRKLPHVSIK